MSCESFDYGRCGDCWLATGVANGLGAAFQEVYARGAEKQSSALHQPGYLDYVSERAPEVVERCVR